ncbi:MAG: 3-oxoacyl-ACP synthase III family protein, partial [Bacteroidota bacterium]
MYINAVGHYLPEKVIPNSYFKDVNGLTEDWIVARTGIKERRKAAEHENTNTMAAEAVRNLIKNYKISTQDINLIVGCTYSPYDTVGNIAQIVQKKWQIPDTVSINIGAACSTFINGLELTEGYFGINKADKALVIDSEHNTLFGHEDDDKSGHLWGDGAAAVYISKEVESEHALEIVDVFTKGHANDGKGPDGVWLRPLN